jgi:hypothetical protein
LLLVEVVVAEVVALAVAVRVVLEQLLDLRFLLVLQLQ